MSDSVTILGTFKVNEGKLDALLGVVTRFTEASRGEAGCTIYETWLSEDKKTLHWFERYTDSAAVLVHLQNVQSLLPELMKIVTPSGFTMYGPPSEQLREAVSAFGMTHMTSIGGFSR